MCTCWTYYNLYSSQLKHDISFKKMCASLLCKKSKIFLYKTNLYVQKQPADLDDQTSGFPLTRSFVIDS